MNLFQQFIDAHFRSVESRMPNVEKPEGVPADKAYEHDLNDRQVEAQDSLFGVNQA